MKISQDKKKIDFVLIGVVLFAAVFGIMLGINFHFH